MDKSKRKFLLEAFAWGGAVACASFGFSPLEIAWASNVQKAKKKSTGCTPPSTGAVLLGNEGTGETYESAGANCCINGYELGIEGTYTTSWSGGCSTATLASIKFYCRNVATGNIKGILRDSSGNLIAATQAAAIDDSYVGKTVTCTFASPPTLNASTAYRLGVIPDTNYIFDAFLSDNSSYNLCYSDDGSYASPASGPVAACDIDTGDDGALQIWGVH